MEAMVQKITESLFECGLVPVEVSARHVHLSAADLNRLFGVGYELHPERDLSQKGQFLSKERLTLVGSKRKQEHVAILGPLREKTQIEISRSDCVVLGITAPVRESGETADSGAITLQGPCGSIELQEGAIIARNHLHVPTKTAHILGVLDHEMVDVLVFSERPVIFRNVVVRVNTDFRFRMHIDHDEANAALVNGFVMGKIIRKHK